MLQLSRKVGEEIYVRHNDETLVIKVLKNPNSNELILGFEGSKSFDIIRDDIKKKHGNW